MGVATVWCRSRRKAPNVLPSMKRTLPRPFNAIAAATNCFISTSGSLTPVCDNTCFEKTLNFGCKALAAGPPSTPNSLNSCQAERMKTETKRTLPTNEMNAIVFTLPFLPLLRSL
uniref:Uncharacterized protein n=1 Tax=Opuntia streptacantha TaxID=393608 RepID=A0A7C8YCC0_OPUST